MRSSLGLGNRNTFRVEMLIKRPPPAPPVSPQPRTNPSAACRVHLSMSSCDARRGTPVSPSSKSCNEPTPGHSPIKATDACRVDALNSAANPRTLNREFRRLSPAEWLSAALLVFSGGRVEISTILQEPCAPLVDSSPLLDSFSTIPSHCKRSSWVFFCNRHSWNRLQMRQVSRTSVALYLFDGSLGTTNDALALEGKDISNLLLGAS